MLTTGETSGRFCFQDGGKSNGGRIWIFQNKFSAVYFANLERIIPYPHRVYEGEAVFTPHTGRKHHNGLRMFTTEKLSKNSVKNYKPPTGLPLI